MESQLQASPKIQNAGIALRFIPRAKKIYTWKLKELLALHDDDLKTICVVTKENEKTYEIKISQPISQQPPAKPAT
ncbi:MAG: hypothetical protein LBE32_07055 [Burkholderiales bacterium]|jgi:hypothetical protein|nr:hypothetical protein [Burkholderiales bacterium]